MEPATSVHRERARPDAAVSQQSAELALEWDRAFEVLTTRVGTHFARSDLRAHAAEYLEGLLRPVERKNGWQLAEATGQATPYALQHLLGRAQWDADAVRDDLRRYVVSILGDPRAALVLDDSGFVKKGVHSVGVKRQYCGRLGKVENCQVGVFLGYAAPRGHTFVDRALYLPAEWAADPVRREKTDVPLDVRFLTKPELGRAMLARAFAARMPVAWVLGDEVYGSDAPLRRDLERRRRPYVLTVRCDHRVFLDGFRQTAKAIGDALPAKAWQRLSAGVGEKGPRLYDWAYVPFKGARPKNWQHGLLFRRSLEDPTDVAYHVAFARRGTTRAALVRAAGLRWTIEESLEGAKGEVGLAQYEVRSWHGWHRHITLALWMHAFLTVQRAEAPAPIGGKNRASESPPRTHPAHRARGPMVARMAPVERAA